MTNKVFLQFLENRDGEDEGGISGEGGLEGQGVSFSRYTIKIFIKPKFQKLLLDIFSFVLNVLSAMLAHLFKCFSDVVITLVVVLNVIWCIAVRAKPGTICAFSFCHYFLEKKFRKFNCI